MRASSLPADCLEVEIAENTAMRNPKLSQTILDRLREIDDFGTGYSSLANLKHFPVTRLKVDKAFVQDVAQSATMAIVLAIIRMAHSLNLEVIAEGVETEAQLEFLKRNQCNEAQGLLYSEPIPAE